MVAPPPSADAALLTLGFVAGGICLGTASGLIPGLHVNALALLLAAAAPTLPGPPAAVGAAVLAAGVVHTFLDVVPALVLGVPDAATAAGSLPGHRLVLAGRGKEALRLSALGSGAAVAVAVPLSLPLSTLVAAGRTELNAALPFLLAAVVCLLVAAEPTWRRRLAAVGCFGLAAALGFLALDAPTAGALVPDAAASMLAPLFAGLFGAPVLVDALSGRGAIPPQVERGVALPPRTTLRAALSGVGGGALVGYLPGVSAGVATVLALGGVGGETGAEATPHGGRERTDRAYVVATSGADTATAVFAATALTVLGDERSGVAVALSAVGGGGSPFGSVPALAVVVFAAGVGTALVPLAGDRYLAAVGRLPHRPLSLAVLVLLWVLSAGFAGWPGLCAFAVAALVGLAPPRLGVRRVHLMGVLLAPVAVGSLG
ncbi:tripartite tricarboxylate transporter permease [Halogeometricum sp. S1BR25-6]|uniref:Tripartite tricarboxylate transporter permease n=1 Tax=Halogeometricum salsisoli TaxID=2950536 RepID=A0ABU2GEI2_9EURY|nr:tripartite tricarboxylate transporter permease [Halogeometricum sp. S1BR25-6]MDS0299220.1 tripartite tricarboxylate transporter permease [Halogeometricum sp. S1BR25-6]